MHNKILSTFFIVLTISNCLASEMIGEKDVRGDIWVEYNNFPYSKVYREQPNHILILGGKVDLSLSLSKVFLKLGCSMNHDFNDPDASRYRMDNAFLNFFTKMFDFKIGYQRVSWQVVDIISKADVINQRDYTFDAFSPTKLSDLIALTKLSFGSHICEFYLLPYFKKAILPTSGNRYDFFANSHPLAVTDKNTSYEGSYGAWRTQCAFRYRLFLGELDMALFYFNGYRRFPILELDYTQEGVPVFRQSYHLINTGGLTFQGNLFGNSMRAEIVVNSFQNELKNAYMEKVKPYAEFSAGIQRTFYFTWTTGELDAILELTGDSDYGKSLSEIEGIRLYQSNICVGVEYRFNNNTKREITIVPIADYHNHDGYLSLSYSETLCDIIKLEISYNGLIYQKSDAFSSLKNSDKISLKLGYEF